MRCVWLLYVAIGLGAFGLSYVLEGFVFSDITGSVAISFAAAGVFESAKIVTIVMHRFLSNRRDKRIPLSVGALTVFFKLGLFVLSMLCSLTMISGFLEAPHLKEVRMAERERIETHYREALSFLERDRARTLEKTREGVAEKYERRRRSLEETYTPAIEAARTSREREFERKVNGVRKGEFWYEYDRRLRELQKEYDEKMSALSAEELRETSPALAQFEKSFDERKAALDGERQASLASLVSDVFLLDDRVRNRMVSSMLNTLRAGLDIDVKYMQFIAAFSILSTILLEAAIYIIFNYLTIARMDFLALKDDLETEEEMLRLKTRGRLMKESIGFEGFKRRVLMRMKGIGSILSGGGPEVPESEDARIYNIDDSKKEEEETWKRKQAR